jgi:hypothetical protein
MEASRHDAKSSKRHFYLAFLSLTLFLSPITIYVMARIFSLENQTFAYQDAVMFAGYWLSALLVWSRVKFMWLVTVGLLSVVILINVVAMLRNISSDNSPVYLTQFLLSVATLSGVLIIADYMNSIYFDRRDQFSIFGAADRYVVSLDAQIVNQKDQMISGRVSSLSFSGAVFETIQLPDTFYLKQLELQIPEIVFFGKKQI